MCRNSGMFVSPGQSFFYTRGEIFVAFTLGALYLLFQDPTMWGRIKEISLLLTPPPAFPSFLNNSQHMFPEYDLHMYLLILPKEVCDFFSTLIYSLTLMCYNSPAAVAFSNSVCIFILFSKLPFCPQYLELTLSHVGFASYCTAVKSVTCLFTSITKASFPRAQLTSAQD